MNYKLAVQQLMYIIVQLWNQMEWHPEESIQSKIPEQSIIDASWQFLPASLPMIIFLKTVHILYTLAVKMGKIQCIKIY